MTSVRQHFAYEEPKVAERLTRRVLHGFSQAGVVVDGPRIPVVILALHQVSQRDSALQVSLFPANTPERQAAWELAELSIDACVHIHAQMFGAGPIPNIDQLRANSTAVAKTFREALEKQYASEPNGAIDQLHQPTPANSGGKDHAHGDHHHVDGPHEHSPRDFTADAASLAVNQAQLSIAKIIDSEVAAYTQRRERLLYSSAKPKPLTTKQLSSLADAINRAAAKLPAAKAKFNAEDNDAIDVDVLRANRSSLELAITRLRSEIINLEWNLRAEAAEDQPSPLESGAPKRRPLMPGDLKARMSGFKELYSRVEQSGQPLLAARFAARRAQQEREMEARERAYRMRLEERKRKAEELATQHHEELAAVRKEREVRIEHEAAVLQAISEQSILARKAREQNALSQRAESLKVEIADREAEIQRLAAERRLESNRPAATRESSRARRNSVWLYANVGLVVLISIILIRQRLAN